jgi:hypothetical protein
MAFVSLLYALMKFSFVLAAGVQMDIQLRPGDNQTRNLHQRTVRFKDRAITLVFPAHPGA